MSLNKMNIVGINISHHSSSCLLSDGELIYFHEEERLAKRKGHIIGYHSYGNMDSSGKTSDDLRFYGLESLKKHVKTIDHLVFTSYGRVGKITYAETIFEYLDWINNNGWESFLKMYRERGCEPIILKEDSRFVYDFNEFSFENDRVILHAIVKQIVDAGIEVKNIVFESDQHHIHHASGGYNFSDFDEAAVLVMDGGGSFRMDDYYELWEFFNSSHPGRLSPWETVFREKESVYHFIDNEIKSVYKHYSKPFDIDANEKILLQKKEKIFSHTLSAGDLFNLITGHHFLGFGYGHCAGKTMGLSSYYQDDFPIEFQGDWYQEVETECGPIMVSDPELNLKLKSLKLKYDFKVSEDNMYYPSMLAKKVQIETEKLTIFLIEKVLKMTGTKNLICSGGYFMNCVNNFKYRKHFPDDINIFIDPIPYDAGPAFGCAAQMWMQLTGKKVNLSKNLYLGS